jgi:hypothetical protein
MRARASVALRTTEVLLSACLLVVFFGVRDLPLVDLPQHALQIASWMRVDAHDAAFANLELNFRTPYFACYPLVRILAGVLPVLAALKLTLWLSITAQARALRALCERLGHDPWLGVLGFPLGLGFGFYFGFVAFCAALPLVYLAVLLAVEHRAAPSRRSGVELGALLALLLVAHGIALGLSLAVLGPLLLWGEGKRWQRLLPLLAPALLGAVWLAPPGGTSTRVGPDLWQIEVNRLLELPAQLVGLGSADRIATLLGVLLLVAIAASMGAPRGLVLTLPLVAVLLSHALFPTLFRGVGLIQPRFSAYVVPAVLIAFAPIAHASRARRIGTRALALGVTCAVVGVFAYRVRTFNQETAGFHALIARLPAGLAIRPLVFERAGAAFPGVPAHLHLPAYYTVEKGGSPGYSFAMYSTAVVRYRTGAVVKMTNGDEWVPESFEAAREAEDYDYFIVKSSSDRTSALFAGPRPAAVLDQRVGDWWGYWRAPRAQAAHF